MSTPQTRPQQQSQPGELNQGAREKLPALRGPRLPFHPMFEKEFGIDRVKFTSLVEVIFPTAQHLETLVMALSYCKARGLDVFKRNVHIVPVWSSAAGCMVDTIWPGIGELRTTAHRTGQFAGRGDTVFGPTITQVIGKVDVTYPEWAQVTVWRIVRGERCSFTGPRVFWIETYSEVKRDDPTPNSMWRNRPFGQLDKCAEAAALRVAFPEELGNEHSSDEINHRNTIDVSVVPVSQQASIGSVTSQMLAPQPDGDNIESSPEQKEHNQEHVPSEESLESLAITKALALLKREIASCKTKGQIEGLREDFESSQEFEPLRTGGKELSDECRKEIGRAIARMT